MLKLKKLCLKNDDLSTKLLLSKDLNILLINMIFVTNQIKKDEQKITIINEVLDKWSERINKEVEYGINIVAEKISVKNGFGIDVNSIILKALDTNHEMLRIEFIDEIRELLYSFVKKLNLQK